jgi:polysaccharide biosynthesis transport protein
MRWGSRLARPMDQTHETPTLGSYVRILWRRKWIVLLPVLIVPLATLLVTLRQPRVFEASANTLLSTQDLASTLAGVAQPYIDPTVYGETQARLAADPLLAARALRGAHVQGRTPQQVLQELVVFPQTDASFLTFTIRDHDPHVAKDLANSYAHVFARYRRDLDTAATRQAQSRIQQRLNQFGGAPSHNSALYATYASLVDKVEQLRTMAALQGSNAEPVTQAVNAVQVEPRPKRNTAVALALGILLGVGLAFLWNSLDTRIRSAEQVKDALGIPLLARIPEPPRRMRRANQMTMLADPNSLEAESFRMLRTNFEFVNLERQANTIMFTSATESEGKSTTVVNLAVAFARAGRRVALVDLDLRRPFLRDVFELRGRPGVTDVALGEATLDEALTSVAVAQPDAATRASGNGHGPVTGVLEVLHAGVTPPDPGEFVSSPTVGAMLERLSERADIVLIDSPPLLHVGDAMALSANVDAIVLITRLNVVRRPMLSELRRLLHSSPAATVGFVATGSGAEEGYGYAGYYAYTSRQPERARAAV